MNRRVLRVVGLLLIAILLSGTIAQRPSSTPGSVGFAATVILVLLLAAALIVVGVVVGRRILDGPRSDSEKFVR